ncbi:hypothetical protein pb186bvf_001671 [Paramecium bursaria]
MYLDVIILLIINFTKQTILIKFEQIQIPYILKFPHIYDCDYKVIQLMFSRLSLATTCNILLLTQVEFSLSYLRVSRQVSFDMLDKYLKFLLSAINIYNTRQFDNLYIIQPYKEASCKGSILEISNRCSLIFSGYQYQITSLNNKYIEDFKYRFHQQNQRQYHYKMNASLLKLTKLFIEEQKLKFIHTINLGAQIKSLLISLIKQNQDILILKNSLSILTIYLLLMKNFKNKYLYEEKGLLGEGSFGKVYKGKDKDTDEAVAIKLIAMDQYTDPFMIECLRAEIQIQMKMDHKNIVKLLDAQEDKKTTVMVLELCDGGDLEHFLESHGGHLSEQVAQEVLLQMMCGFKEITDKGYIHRDIKPANLFMKGDLFKIADFGFACQADIKGKKKLDVCCGTPLYMAPQLLENMEYTSKCDIWSIGIIAYELIYGKQPWPCLDEESYLRNMKKMPLRFPYDKSISEQYKDFIRECLVVNEDERVTWEEVFRHEVLHVNDKTREFVKKDIDTKTKRILAGIQRVVMARDIDVNKEFKKIDNQGSLDESEFYFFLSNLDPTVTTYENKIIFDLLDTDKSGRISFGEFQAIFLDYDFADINDKAGRIIQDLRELLKNKNVNLDDLFKEFDKDKSGQLELVEFVQLIQRFAEDCPDKVCQKVFAKFDRDNSGSVSIYEFKKELLYATDKDEHFDPKEEKKNKILKYLGTQNQSYHLDNLSVRFEYNEKKDFLGKGSFGTVYKGKDKKTGDYVAIKFISNEEYQDDFLFESLQTEVASMKQLRSPNVVNLIELYGNEKNTVFVVELCDGGDVDGLINKKGGFLDENLAQEVLRQVMKGFQKMVENKYIHRDIKPQNMLIKGNTYKVADFGFATKADISGKVLLQDIVGSPIYMAPQLLDNQPYSAKCDIWSIGIVAFQMVYGCFPWPCRDIKSYLRNIMTTPLRFPYDKKISEQYKDFLKKCLVVDESQRIGWDKVFDHPVLIVSDRSRQYDQQVFDTKIRRILADIQKVSQARGINIPRMFKQVDTDQGGSLDTQEFYKFLIQLDPSVTTIDARDVQKAFDKDQDGRISFDEFQKIFCSIDFQDTNDRGAKILTDIREIVKAHGTNIRQLFEQNLIKGKQDLDYDQFAVLVKKLAPSLKDFEIQLVFQKFDADGNRKLSFEEFHRELVFATKQDSQYNPRKLKAEKVINELKRLTKQNNIQVQQIFRNFDSDRSNKLEFEEFKKMVQIVDKTLTDDEYRLAFKLIDTQDKDFITEQQFTAQKYLIYKQKNHSKFFSLLTHFQYSLISMKQYFIIDKIVKEPSDVYYQVKRVQQQKEDKIKWKLLTDMKQFISIIEQYEIRQYSEGEGVKYVELIENYITDGKEYLYAKTSELNLNTIENRRVYHPNKDQNGKIQVEPNDSLQFLYQKQGQMKEVIKDIRKINRERGDVKISNRKVFTESQIDKIVTYMRDELDINKYIFLVKFKQNQREVYPTWIPQDRMLIYAPNLLEQYIKTRNIQL